MGYDRDHYLWDANKGNPLDKAPNGEPSVLFGSLMNLYNNREVAIRKKAPMYYQQFQAAYKGRFDANGEPLFQDMYPTSLDKKLSKPTVLPLSTHRDLYEKYKLLDKEGKIKIVSPGTQSTKHWLKRLNSYDPKFLFETRVGSDGKSRIFILEKPSAQGRLFSLEQSLKVEDTTIKEDALESLDEKLINNLKNFGIKKVLFEKIKIKLALNALG